jgi:microsomal dipeptidase-like Zn-dependent dipeptidase
MLFDVDHMSYNTRSAALDIAEAAHYPVISGHSGFIDVCLGDKRHEGQQTGAEVDRIRGTGGMVAPIIAQGKLDEINTWTRPDGTSIPHLCGGTANSYVQAYLYAIERMNGGPVGIGTDFNGFAGIPGPTAGPNACPGGKDMSEPPVGSLSYPFTAPSGVQLDRCTAGNRTFDINTDGLAHVGMLPDFIAYLAVMGVEDDELQPLLTSADGFVQTWKRAGPATSRIAVLSSNGSLSVKEGGLDAAWVLETGGPGGGDTKSFRLDGDRIAVLSNTGALSVKEGDLDAAWVLETGGPGGGDTKNFQLDG